MIDYSKWSAQRLFNKIARHLLSQGAKAQYKNTFGTVCTCYDKKTGRRCAVGCLLPLSYYKKNGNADLSTVNFVANLYNRDILIDYLRMCHDNVKPSRWPSRLRAIARSQGLEIPTFLRSA